VTASSERRAELTLPAPAKLNLYLEVLGRRADGFHELLTVLQTVDLCDEVTVALRPRAAEAAGASGPPGKGARPDVRLSLRTPGAGVPTGPGNLAVRAAGALLERAGAAGEVGVDIALAKRIPAGGGLGGGSSDAAATLLALNRLLGAPLDAPALHAVAAGLGSDVPFFLHGGTALCSGRGDIVQALAPPRPFGLTLLMPPFATATAAVYGALDAPPPRACEPRAAELAARVEGADPDALEHLFRNDLEPAARRVEPRIGALLDATGLHLSGSGSTLFGFGRCERDIHAACESALICFVDSRIGKA
jgi:4-diphosphocytidyl-2-C-methyl-D-erythritol kinase